LGDVNGAVAGSAEGEEIAVRFVTQMIVGQVMDVGGRAVLAAYAEGTLLEGDIPGEPPVIAAQVTFVVQEPLTGGFWDGSMIDGKS
jgi:hypothetical protein